jgi:hypothetical protein
VNRRFGSSIVKDDVSSAEHGGCIRAIQSDALCRPRSRNRLHKRKPASLAPNVDRRRLTAGFTRVG